MTGFFSENLTVTKRVATVTGCGACGLHKECNSPKMKPVGEGEKGILIIGTSPCAKADARNDALAGNTTQSLRKQLRKYGIDLERDCVKMDALACHAPKDDEILQQQIDSCRPNVFNQIKKMKPRLILAFGVTALQSLIGHRWKKNFGSMQQWRGWTIPDRDLKAWLCPMFHPTYVSDMSEKNPSFPTVFNADLKRALKKANEELPYYRQEEECIEIISGDALTDYLRRLNRGQLVEIAFDYETTGLKPHSEGHQIVSCAIAEDENISKAFLMPKDKPTLNSLKRLLSNKYIPKIAQNMKFEDIWTAVRLGVQVQGWKWDTMLVSHMLDNRKGVTGLKFQAYVRFGIINYDSEVSNFLKGVDDKDGNSLNRILDAPVKSLLKYNAMDSLLEFRLYELQKREMNGFKGGL